MAAPADSISRPGHFHSAAAVCARAAALRDRGALDAQWRSARVELLTRDRRANGEWGKRGRHASNLGSRASIRQQLLEHLLGARICHGSSDYGPGACAAARSAASSQPISSRCSARPAATCCARAPDARPRRRCCPHPNGTTARRGRSRSHCRKRDERRLRCRGPPRAWRRTHDGVPRHRPRGWHPHRADPPLVWRPATDSPGWRRCATVTVPRPRASSSTMLASPPALTDVRTISVSRSSTASRGRVCG